MAEIDLAALISPISESEPCGPDLDLAGDADYMNYVAKAESLLPSSFFSGPEGQPFDRSSIDFAAELAAMKPLLADTRDIRLLVLLAKLLILNRDLAGFETAVRAMQELLKEYWDAVHPRGDDGMFNARSAALETLDDLPQVIFPLQYTPLIRHARLGAVSYRHYMIASGEVQAREGEETPDLTAIENALMEVDLPELVRVLGSIDALAIALADILTVCIDRAGIEQAPKLERLPGLVGRIRTLLNGVVAKRDPSVALAAGAPVEGGEAVAAAPEGTGEVRSLADAADALAAIADYFVRKEPSNPALLLVRQAQQLMGKSFVEVMQILVPAHVEQAAIYIGKEQTLQLPIGRLSELVSSSGEWSAANGGDGDQPERRLEANTRADAVRLLDQIGLFYRAAEPSSPLPYLTDRARDLAGRDFLSLLKHVLPSLSSSD
jgi:type VI secretion system protein ImpA